MKRLDSITDSMDMNLNKFWEIMENRGAQHVSVLWGHKKSDMTVTEQEQHLDLTIFFLPLFYVFNITIYHFGKYFVFINNLLQLWICLMLFSFNFIKWLRPLYNNISYSEFPSLVPFMCHIFYFHVTGVQPFILKNSF